MTWSHHLDFNEILEEKATLELHKNAAWWKNAASKKETTGEVRMNS